MTVKARRLRLILSVAFMAVMATAFSSCILLTLLFGGGSGGLGAGKVSYCDLVTAESGELYVAWSTGALDKYDLYITIEPDDGNLGAIQQTETMGSLRITGLSPYKYYTAKATTYDSDGSEYDSKTSGSKKPDGSAVKEVNYSSGINNAIELDPDTSVLKINGVGGKQIMFANINTAPYDSTSVHEMQWGDPRYVFKASSVVSPSRSAVGSDVHSADAQEVVPDSGIKHFDPPVKDLRRVSYHSDSAVSRAVTGGYESLAASDDFNANSPAVNQTKTIWIDCNSKMDTYKPVKMTLRSIGRNTKNEIECFVWVQDSNFSTIRSSGAVVSQKVCDDIAEKFVKHNRHEQAVFGQTSDKLMQWVADSDSDYEMDDNEVRRVDMTSDNHKTGTYVNIVIYDIGNDYNASSGTGGGVVGYFYAKDYYKAGAPYSSEGINNDGSTKNVLGATNEGKYFYIDAPFCNMSGKSSTSYLFNGTVNGGVSKTVVSTLFHEFQHMIDFGTKDMQDVEVSNDDHWFNEMLSMMAEDLMTQQLDLEDEDDAVSAARLPNFNKYYYYSGLAEYRDDSNYSVLSYSTAYAFGAYTVRNYGGPQLIKEMSTNKYYGLECMIQAIKALGYSSLADGKEVTSENLLQEFVQACAFRTKFSKSNNLPSFNVLTGSPITTDYYGNASTSSVNTLTTLTSTLKGINLFSDSYGWTQDGVAGKFYGPLTYARDKGTVTRPTGFLLHTVGQVSSGSDSVTLYFTNRHDKYDKTWVYIQDNYDNSNLDSTKVETY